MKFAVCWAVFYCLFGFCQAEILNKAPKKPNLDSKYVFYLHGAIVEGSDGRPKSQKYGFYEYNKILKRLSEEGYTVISSIRPGSTDVVEYSKKINDEIISLKKLGVPSSSIAVVGASKGGMIACRVSALLNDADVSYVILAGLFEQHLKQDYASKLSGRILSIHDANDRFNITPDLFFRQNTHLSAKSSIVTDLNVGHGLLYKDYDEWIRPFLKWFPASQTFKD